MLDFDKEFSKFDGNITLTQVRKSKIRNSRDAIRAKIKKYFKDELHLSSPIFRMQGSFTINTALNPLVDEEVDADDGLYLTHVDEKLEEEDWPTPNEVHKYVMDALNTHTQDGNESKTSCVRVIYRNFYHLDIPVYIMKSDSAYLGQTNNNTWINSDSKEFKNWFYANRMGENNSQIIRYLKAWRDNNKTNFTSIELTIIGVKYFIEDERVDLALLYTLENIYSKLKLYRRIDKPVAPFENLWDSLSISEIDNKILSIRNFLEDLSNAINNISNQRASLILIELFGNRFPEKKDKIENKYVEYKSGAKPWGME